MGKNKYVCKLNHSCDVRWHGGVNLENGKEVKYMSIGQEEEKKKKKKRRKRIKQEGSSKSMYRKKEIL